ncbi:MAG TPA: protein kinase, partial [Candidatus Sulfotelmatobacter sp.]
DALQRFDREARAISSLSHPNVCHLYDVGSQDGTTYLVMEYLEGETLADRLSKGPLPLEQVLKYGIEICEGLERAHRGGVIHRDLKPGNIMLTKSGAKLMDFGLAKPVTPASPASSGLTQTLATPQHPLTVAGVVVGTFQYMAPEQLEGKEADARSDIFALGAVLYEMITGNRAFEGKTTASTIAAILAADPPAISSVQPLSPVALEGTVKSCLAKDPDERLQTAHDVKLQLKWIQQSGSSSRLPAVPAAHKPLDRVGWLAAGVLLLLLVGFLAWWFATRETPSPMYFNSSVPFPTNYLALSPDGKRLALVAFSDQANKNVIWLQQIGGRGATIVPGTEGAVYPFWSPNGRSLGFFADGKLKTIDVASGRSAQSLADSPFGRGGSWSKDGVILYNAGRVERLVSHPVLRRNAGAGDQAGRFPVPGKQSMASLPARWPALLVFGVQLLRAARPELDFCGLTRLRREQAHRQREYECLICRSWLPALLARRCSGRPAF